MKLNQQDFGKLIGATRGMIATYELGKNDPKSEVVEKIREVFGIPRKALFSSLVDVNNIKREQTMSRQEALEQRVKDLESVIAKQDKIIGILERGNPVKK